MIKFIFSCLLLVNMSLTAQINLGTGSTDVGVAPVSTYYSYSYVQQIFTKQEINANAAGNITGLKFYLDPLMSLTNSSDWVVYLGHTPKTSFTSDTDWIPVSQLTQVYAGTITSVNGVVEVTFSTPFPYNNTDNLVIAAEENSQDYDDNDDDEVFYVYDGAANSSLYYNDDTNNPDPTSPSDGNLVSYKSVITIMGLTGSSLPACPTITYPVNNDTFIPLSPDITWLASQSATSYKISIGTTPGGTDVVNQQVVSSTSFTPSTALLPNTNYYVKVIAVGSGGESAGCSNIMFKTIPPPPVNDSCLGALTVASFPYNYTQADAESTTNNSGFISVCGGDVMNDGAWFKFTGDGDTFDVTVEMPAGSSFDPQIGIYTGNCGSLVCEGTVDDGADGDVETISFPTVSGTEYYINVGHYDATSDEPEDIFSINITKNALGISEVSSAKNSIKLYPNPFTETLNISDVAKVKLVLISDMSGRLVKTIGNPASILHVGDLRSGMYLVTLNMKDGSKQTVKVIKK